MDFPFMKRLRRYKNPNHPVQYMYGGKFVLNKALEVRSLAIALGKPTLIDIMDETCPMRMAELELKNNILPIIFKFNLDNGESEYWEFDDDQDVYKDLSPANPDNDDADDNLDSSNDNVVAHANINGSSRACNHGNDGNIGQSRSDLPTSNPSHKTLKVFDVCELPMTDAHK